MDIDFAESEQSIQDWKRLSNYTLVTICLIFPPPLLFIIISIFEFQARFLYSVTLDTFCSILIGMGIFMMYDIFRLKKQTKDKTRTIKEFKMKNISGDNKLPTLKRIIPDRKNNENTNLSFIFGYFFWEIPISVSIPEHIVEEYLLSLKQTNKNDNVNQINKTIKKMNYSDDDLIFLSKLYTEQPHELKKQINVFIKLAE
jgi:hypothetical protein